MNLENFIIELFSKFPLEVIKENCINQKNLLACEKCKEICPHEAISFDEENKPIVNFEKCTLCGLCFSECPVNVFQLKFHWDKLYNSKKVISISCFLTEKETDVKVPCLTWLNEEILASLHFFGSEEILLYTAPCKDCQLNPSNYSFIKSYIEKANLLINYHTGVKTVVKETEEISEELEEKKINRREFFSSLFGRTKQITVQVNSKINVPIYRQLFFETLKRIPSEKVCYKEVEENKLRFSTPVIEPNKCQNSLLCAFWCPTKALKNTEKGVYFTQILCTSCNLCEKICPNNALHLRKSFIPRKNVMAQSEVINKLFRKKCISCGKEFFTNNPNQEYCLYCQKEKEVQKLIEDFLTDTQAFKDNEI
jgi:ferredoxin